MEKSPSYYDWEFSLEPKSRRRGSRSVKKVKSNSLGIPDEILKKFLRKWRAENIPK